MADTQILHTFRTGILTPLQVLPGGVVARMGANVRLYPIPAGTPVAASAPATAVGPHTLPALEGYNLPRATQRVGEFLAGVAYKTPFASNMAAVGWALHEPSGEVMVADVPGFDGFLPQRLSLDGRMLAGVAVRAGGDGLPARQYPGVVDLLTLEMHPLEGILGGAPFGPVAWGQDRALAGVVPGFDDAGAVYRLALVTGWEG